MSLILQIPLQKQLIIYLIKLMNLFIFSFKYFNYSKQIIAIITYYLDLINSFLY